MAGCRRTASGGARGQLRHGWTMGTSKHEKDPIASLGSQCWGDGRWELQDQSPCICCSSGLLGSRGFMGCGCELSLRPTILVALFPVLAWLGCR